MSRVSNFNAGPAALPLPVLERAREELLEFQGTGMSIMEHSHRGKAYEGVHDEAIALVRELAGVPDSHHVLFMQGGACQQFALVPMNFLGGRSADYIHTGTWSKGAIDEAKFFGTVRIAAQTDATRVPRAEELQLDPSAAYVHVTSNNTIEGTQFHYDPATGSVPLVADMSSDFLWKKPDVARYGLIYAGAQKNLGPSGVVLVIARKDFVESGRKDIPKIFRYSTVAAANSLYNTPPTFAIYAVGLVMKWLAGQGGLTAIARINERKAGKLYAEIDRTGFYRGTARKEHRSLMNITFRLPSGHVKISENQEKALDDFIVEELLYEKGLKIGLDKDPGYQAIIDRMEHQLAHAKRVEMTRRVYNTQIAAKVEITNSQAKNFYDQNADRIATELHLGVILFSSKERAEEAQKKIRGGATFESIAREVMGTQGPAGKEPGDLGFLSWDRIPSDFFEAVYKLKPGEVSGVVSSKRTGYQIFKLFEVRKNAKADFASLSGLIVNRLRDEKMGETFGQYVEKLKKEAKIEKF